LSIELDSATVGAVIPYPSEPYLQLTGQIVYALSYLESLIFGDLRALGVVVDGASRLEMGRQIQFLEKIKQDPALGPLSGFVSAAIDALKSVQADRNSFIHAGAAASDHNREPVRYRWAIAAGLKPSEAKELDEEWLRSFCVNIEYAITTLSAERVPTS
jgi:hypothetical protein